MSSTTLYSVKPNGDVVHLARFRNAFRAAPMFWNYMLVKLELRARDSYVAPYWGLLWGGDPSKERSILSFDDGEGEDPVKRAERRKELYARMSDAEWLVLQTTFDRCVVEATPENVTALVAAFKEIHSQIEGFNAGQRKVSSSFLEQAEAIAQGMKDHPDIQGFAWTQTSVSDAWPIVPTYAFDPNAPGEDSALGGDYACPNLERDGGFFVVKGLRLVEDVEAKHEHVVFP